MKLIPEAVRELCLWPPETEEVISHGCSSFKVRRKIFGYYLVNHHGDGRVALWLNTGQDLQRACVEDDPEIFFVPPYVGPRGWLGVSLDRGLSWNRVGDLVRAAYEKTAPPALGRTLGRTPRIRPPAGRLAADVVDPLKSTAGKALLELMREACASLPQVREGVRFGFPAWQAGQRTFAMARCAGRRLTATFWVGVERQLLLTADERYRIPPYLGHKGWIDLDVTSGCERDEIAALALQSYRHFAAKRMLRSLPPDPGSVIGARQPRKDKAPVHGRSVAIK